MTKEFPQGNGGMKQPLFSGFKDIPSSWSLAKILEEISTDPNDTVGCGRVLSRKIMRLLLRSHELFKELKQSNLSKLKKIRS